MKQPKEYYLSFCPNQEHKWHFDTKPCNEKNIEAGWQDLTDRPTDERYLTIFLEFIGVVHSRVKTHKRMRREWEKFTMWIEYLEFRCEFSITNFKYKDHDELVEFLVNL